VAKHKPGRKPVSIDSSNNSVTTSNFKLVIRYDSLQFNNILARYNKKYIQSTKTFKVKLKVGVASKILLLSVYVKLPP
jgi:hypothetical protein